MGCGSSIAYANREGDKLFIFLHSKLHLTINLATLDKVQSWANHPRGWERVILGKKSRYYIETTNHGKQDHSDYTDRELWSDILDLITEEVMGYEEMLRLSSKSDNTEVIWQRSQHTS